MRDVSLLCIRKALPDYLRLGEKTLIICLMWCPGDLLKVNKESRFFFFFYGVLTAGLNGSGCRNCHSTEGVKGHCDPECVAVIHHNVPSVFFWAFLLQIVVCNSLHNSVTQVFRYLL